MQYRTLGRTGMKVSAYALGAMMFGRVGNPDHEDSIRIIHKALDAGINLIDTADAYSRGESEEIVGKAIAARRDQIVLATKFGLPMSEDPNERGASRRWINQAVDGSLRRLGTDHIDLYQLHVADPTTPLEETISALSDLVRAGKIRAFGTSKLPAAELVEAQWTADRHALEAPSTEQPPYSILDRAIEADVLPTARKYDLGVLVWSPMAQGLLTGRVRDGRPTDLRRTAMFTHLSDQRRLDAVDQVTRVAEQSGLKMTHLAIAFAIAHPDVTAAIIGPRTMEHLDDLLAGADVTLSDDILDQLDAIVAPGTDVGHLDMAYTPPAVAHPELRRRPADQRTAA